jgi:hypothetical protein
MTPEEKEEANFKNKLQRTDPDTPANAEESDSSQNQLERANSVLRKEKQTESNLAAFFRGSEQCKLDTDTIATAAAYLSQRRCDDVIQAHDTAAMYEATNASKYTAMVTEYYSVDRDSMSAWHLHDTADVISRRYWPLIPVPNKAETEADQKQRLGQDQHNELTRLTYLVKFQEMDRDRSREMALVTLQFLANEKTPPEVPSNPSIHKDTIESNESSIEAIQSDESTAREARSDSSPGSFELLTRALTQSLTQPTESSESKESDESILPVMVNAIVVNTVDDVDNGDVEHDDSGATDESAST